MIAEILSVIGALMIVVNLVTEIAKKLGAESLYSHYLRCIINNKTIDFIL